MAAAGGGGGGARAGRWQARWQQREAAGAELEAGPMAAAGGSGRTLSVTIGVRYGLTWATGGSPFEILETAVAGQTS